MSVRRRLFRNRGRSFRQLRGSSSDAVRGIHRGPARAAGAGEFLEASGNRCAALRAAAIGAESIVANVVPVAFDQRRAAGGAEGRVTLGVVRIAGVDVMQADFIASDRNRSGDDLEPPQFHYHFASDLLVNGIWRRVCGRISTAC